MLRILLVEDDSSVRDRVAQSLGRPEWELEFAVTNTQAVEWIALSAPDVVITGLNPPDVNGLELVRQIRSHSFTTPIILMTSGGSEPMAVEALKEGATSFSPVESIETDLASTVQKVLDVARRMRYTHDVRLLPRPGQVAFVLENEISLIGPLIEHLQSRLPGWSDRDRLQIGMAMDEALINAMHHGNLEVSSELREAGEGDGSEYYNLARERKDKEPFCDRRVRLEAEFSDQHICVQISDDGPGFNPKTVADPTSEENVRKVCGRGLFLIRSFMDQVVHNMTGNQITMVKLRREA